MAKRRYRVKRGQTYLDIANATGVDIGALLSANSATPTPVGGFNVNIPTAPNTVGAPPPPMGGRGPVGGGVSSLPAATMPGGYFASPLSPAQGPTSAPAWNPTGNAESRSREGQAYIPQTMPNLNNGVVTPNAPTSQPMGQIGGLTIYSPADPAFAHLFAPTINNPNGRIFDTSVNLTLTPEAAAAVMAGDPANGIPAADPDALTALGFVQQSNGEWVRRTGTTSAEPRNAGGWMQSSDGSWHLNRNASQTRKKEEREANRKKANQSSTGSPVNWSI